MPRRRKLGPELPAAIQLPLFAEAAALIRVRPERNEARHKARKTSLSKYPREREAQGLRLG